MNMMTSFYNHWFTPHYTNNHRPKLLQPFGLSILVALFLIVQTSIQLTRTIPLFPGGFVLGYASSITASQVIELTNVERAKAGLPALVNNDQLNQAALAKANYMFLHDYWAHVAPDGTTPWVFIKNAGYNYSVAGENLARDFNDTAAMVQAWMNSPTHKANVVHPKYTQIGVAVVNGKLQGVETTLVVQMFGAPLLGIPQTSTQGATSNQPIAKQAPAPAATIPPVVATQPTEPPTLGINEVTASPAHKSASKTISPLTITKIAASALILLLVFVLAYDSLIMDKRKLPRKVGNNWAHVAFFGIVLVIIIAISEGSIL